MTSAANIMARWRSRLQPEWDRTSVTLLANRGAIEPVSKTNGIDRGIFTSVADLKRKIIRYRQTISVEILRCPKARSGVGAMSQGPLEPLTPSLDLVILFE